MSILTAISRGCRGTLVDGSVRYTIEFTPLEAIAAATLFGMPGTEMGVVALKDGRALNGGLSDEKLFATNKHVGLQARADNTEDVLDMVGQQNAVLDDKRTCRSPDDAALPMANEECSAGGFISALADQLADAGKPIVGTPMEIAKRGLITIAGMLSNDRKFWEYVGTMYPVTPTNADEVAAYIRRECGIKSRVELAIDNDAAKKFRQIMRSFDEWSKK